jgi:hypothetical protein
LAQVVDPAPTEGVQTVTGAPSNAPARPGAIPPVGQGNAVPPPTNRVNPPFVNRNDVPPADREIAPFEDRVDNSTVSDGDPRFGTDVPIGAGPALSIGTLTVDQSGTGRMQQLVEGVQVEAVIGQAIALYSQHAAVGNSLPRQLRRGVDPVGNTTSASIQGGGASGNAAAQAASGVTNPGPRANNSRVRGGGASGSIAAEASPTTADNSFPHPTGQNAPGPVAAGLIRQISGQVPGAAGVQAAAPGNVVE